MIKNNKILFVVVAIEYVFIAIIIFILLGIGNTNAQSLTWNNPTYISLNNGNPGYNIVAQVDNGSSVGILGKDTYNASHAWAIYQVNKNNINSSYQYLDKSSYTITFQAVVEKYNANQPITIVVFDNGTQYTGTCDAGLKQDVTEHRVVTDWGTTNLTRVKYTCNRLNVNLDNVSYISIGITNNLYNINYFAIESNLVLIDLNDTSADTDKIVANNNKNTQDIINAINGGNLNDTSNVDKGKLEDYEEIENELLNKDNLDNIKDIKIDVDADALEYVFELLTRIVNTHQLVYGLIITMLSLGVIKLILNR